MFSCIYLYLYIYDSTKINNSYNTTNREAQYGNHISPLLT